VLLQGGSAGATIRGDVAIWVWKDYLKGGEIYNGIIKYKGWSDAKMYWHE